MEVTRLESCHSTWILDTDGMRFRRILKDIQVAHQAVSTQWRPYSHLQIEPGEETFTVFLNADRTRSIRSWRHTHDCVQCGGHVTGELSMEDIRQAVGV